MGGGGGGGTHDADSKREKRDPSDQTDDAFRHTGLDWTSPQGTCTSACAVRCACLPLEALHVTIV